MVDLMAVTSSKPSVVPRAPARARDGTPALNGHIDPVTGLGDRRAICARIDELLVAEGCAGTVVVFSVDLDRFQVVNDHLGHEADDLVLALIGHRLSEISGPDNVARLGGDEFVVVGSCESRSRGRWSPRTPRCVRRRTCGADAGRSAWPAQ